MTQRQILERAERIKNPMRLTKQDVFDALHHFKWCCAYCGCRLSPKSFEKDHIIALDKGGLTRLDNIIPACRHCNASKGNKNYYQWFINQPFYDRQKVAKIDVYIIIMSMRVTRRQNQILGVA